MKTPTFRHIGYSSVAAAAILALGSCTDEDQTAKIEELTEQLENARSDVKLQRDLLERSRAKQEESRSEAAKLKTELRTAERQLRDAERELQRYRRQEELAKQKEEEKPDAREMRAAAKETVAGSRDRMVEIAGDSGRGVGVMVETGGKTWIYADRGLVEGSTRLTITTSDGGTLQRFGNFEVAGGPPLVRLEVLEDEVEGLPAAGPDDPVERSTPLLAFDAAGELVEGRSYGDGSEGGLRVDTRLSACPPGSPVFHGETGKLVGVLADAGSIEPSLWPNPYAQRRDAVALVTLGAGIEWSEVPIGTFLKEARMLERIDDISRLMHAFATTRADAQGVTYGSLPNGMQIEELLGRHKDEPAVRSLRDLDSWLQENGPRSSEADIKQKIGGVYTTIDVMARRAGKELKDTRFSPPHAAAAKRSLEWQEEARKDLNRRLQELE